MTVTPLPERQKPIPARVKRACELLISGEAKNITNAAEAVGYSREHLSRQLGRPHISAYFRDRVAKAVALTSGRAAARLSQLIDTAASEHVQLDAAKFSLGVAGIKPASDAQVSVNVNVQAGFVIDLRARDEIERDKIIEGKATEE